MVTSTEPQEIDENVEIIPETPEEQAPGGDEVATEEQATEEAPAEAPEEAPDAGQPSEARLLNDTAPQQAQPAQPQVDQKAIAELHQRRIAEQEQMWRSKVSKAARAYQQQLEEAGYMPEQARDQAKRYVQQERKFRQQDEEAAGMIGYIQGRHMAAVHYMKKHGLASNQVLDDLTALQNASSPAEMDKAAKRIKEDRALRAENAQLKQGRVAPQTFDNSQGSAEATTNQDRLLDAYLAGDRSDAAVRAARRLTLGS
jgi:hypothetical protein